MCYHLLKPLPHALWAQASGLLSSPFSPCRQHIRRHNVLERLGSSCQKNEWNKISGHVWECPCLLMLHWKHVAEPGIKLKSPSGTAQNLNCITASSTHTTSSPVVTELAGRKQKTGRVSQKTRGGFCGRAKSQQGIPDPERQDTTGIAGLGAVQL